MNYGTITKLLAFLTSINTIRLIGGTQRTLATFQGRLPNAHYLPGIGDMIAGFTAPLIAYLLMKQKIGHKWYLAAIGWNIYGAMDLIIAIPINILYRPTDPKFVTPILALSFLAIHIMSLIIFTRNNYKKSGYVEQH